MKSTYKNKNSIVVQKELIRAVFLPDPGGKMVSLVNRKTGFEFLVQRAGQTYRDQPFGGSYVDGECSGFDDMFPTIDECFCEQDPWKNVLMADHGEVWSLPWDCREVNGVLKMSVRGIRFPYYLEKAISFTDTNTLRISYHLKNESHDDFDFLWAGHFMINMQEGCRIAVPPDCKKAITMLSNGPRKYGQVVDWPSFSDNEGKKYRADISRSEDVAGFEKYYFQNKLENGWCRFEYPHDTGSIQISFPSAKVPYLGILMNEKGWDGLYNVFIEPCTVAYDRPDRARQHGQISTLKASGVYEWYIDITVNEKIYG